ncbi:Scr1 family TA system antitoxin-like transcriptional regulator [Streptomyces sp. NPDC050516]|uniref:helix-turn-helix domain-containing protein n=1 Tax=Streptomyces sp. NPDC050516 TaxID=3365621 RepID=UPI0037A46BB7
MVRRKDIDGSESVPCFYGKELRWKREAAGLTLQQLVEGSFYGLSHLSEIERGQRRMPHDLAEHVDRVLKTDGFFARCCEDVRKAKRAGRASYFQQILDVERTAEYVEEWCPALIPGLLQTEEYARAVVRATHPLEPQDKTDAKVYGRLARAELFHTEHRRPEYWVILHESLLRQPILPPLGMAEQLNQIAELAHQHLVTPQILPGNSGAHPLRGSSAVTYLDFPEAPPLVYTESEYSGETIEGPAPVKLYRRSYDRLRAAALPPATSLTMIEDAAKDYRNGKHQS